MYLNLKKYGLSDRFEQEASLYNNLFPARIIEQHRDLYKVVCEHGELIAGISGKLAYHAEDQMSFPAVGDWVMIDRTDNNSGNAVIKNILGRKSVFVRQTAGTSNEQQIVAANIDIIFICMSLNSDFNIQKNRTLSCCYMGQYGDSGYSTYQIRFMRRFAGEAG